MSIKNISLLYFISIILSNAGKKSFENLGRAIGKSGDTIKRLLPSENICLYLLKKIAYIIFKNRKTLYLSLDSTFIIKLYSAKIEKTEKWYIYKIKLKRIAFKVQIAILTDKKYIIPINISFVHSEEYAKEIGSDKTETNVAISFVDYALENFKDFTLVILGDGFYSSIKFLTHCCLREIDFEIRFHKNKRVFYRSKSFIVSEIKELEILGDRISKTIKNVIWNDMELNITAIKRIDNNGKESIIYTVSPGYSKARSIERAKRFEIRFKSEMNIRSQKQTFGMNDCYSTKSEIQMRYFLSCAVAYSMCQLVRKIFRLLNPESAKRLLLQRKHKFLEKYFYRILFANRIFGD